jgi:hypothetical protein
MSTQKFIKIYDKNNIQPLKKSPGWHQWQEAEQITKVMYRQTDELHGLYYEQICRITYYRRFARVLSDAVGYINSGICSKNKLKVGK